VSAQAPTGGAVACTPTTSGSDPSGNLSTTVQLPATLSGLPPIELTEATALAILAEQQVKSYSVEHKTGWPRICGVAISSQVSDFFKISHSWLRVTRPPWRHPPRRRPHKKGNDKGSSQAGISISFEACKILFSYSPIVYVFGTLSSICVSAICHGMPFSHSSLSSGKLYGF
jgi:hypothetical protein